MEWMGPPSAGFVVAAAFMGVVAAILGYTGMPFLVLLAVVVFLGYAFPRMLELRWRSRGTGKVRDHD
jgi:hypothetical protein